MPKENNKILKYNPGEKSLKVPFIIYADLECILRKMNAGQVIPTKTYTEKKAEHELLGYSQIKCCSFDKSKTECNYYREQDCIKIFCRDLRDRAMKIINHEKKDIIPLTKEEKESYEKQQICYICQEEFCANKNKKELKKSKKSEIMIIMQENIEELLIVNVIYDIKYLKRFL